MDADRVTFACATTAERRVAERAGARTALVGLGVSNGVPDGPVVSFGIAGALHEALPIGTVLDATRVVDAEGTVLWEGQPLGVPGAKAVTMLAADDVVDDASERRRLHELTGADAVDMESGVLAATGRLRGCVRAVSDTTERPLGPLADAVTPDGRPRPIGFLKAVVREPAATFRALANVRRALSALAEVRL
jgi:adenosylhomocysteine nucleosidase